MRGRQDHTKLLCGDKSWKGHHTIEKKSTKTRNGSSRNCNREVAPKLLATPGDELCPVSIYKEY
ncbi:hypothetical protein MAR_037662 [Mya arenaria]|uniref:Uncharacterized protein n=1 Tax=Mya arenaria TaxID=6604 RepID=A0ABY7FT46_MYAAR|nr:hypothetical protein MAR_037662 [Mya arenaria]